MKILQHKSATRLLLMCFLMMLLNVGIGVAGANTASTVTVGGIMCDYNSIQQALDVVTPGSEIRLTIENSFDENINIDKSIELKGGYENCAAAINDDQAEAVFKSEINAGGMGSAISVIGAGLDVKLSQLSLIQGSAITGGGMSVLATDSEVILNNVNVINNSALLGGGIYVVGTETELTLMGASKVSANQASNGGGIYCLNSQLQLLDQTGLFFNEANSSAPTGGFGGGIYAGTDCGVLMKAGEGEYQDFHAVGVSANRAHNSGGGIYLMADNDSQAMVGKLTIINYSNPVNIDNNIANWDNNTTGNGGGIYASNASIYATNLFLDQNQVMSGRGGGLYLMNSEFTGVLDPHNICKKQSEFCNYFSRNKADYGGAVLSMGDSILSIIDLNISKAIFTENRADDGAAIAVTGGNIAQLKSSYVFHNGQDDVEFHDSSLFRAYNNSELILVHNTMANNLNSLVMLSQNDSIIRLINSFVFEPMDETLLADDTSTVSVNCVIVSENQSIFDHGEMDGPVFVSNNTNNFIDSDSNYHLTSQSAAIDTCPKPQNVTINADLDQDIFGTDIPQLGSDDDATYDVGADEYIDRIFKDDFD